MNKQFKLAHDGMLLAAKGLNMAAKAWQYAQDDLSEEEFSEFKDIAGDAINDALSCADASWDESAEQFIAASAEQFIAAAENIEAAYKENKQVITVYTMNLNGVDVELYWTGYDPSDGKPVWSTDINDVGVHHGGMFELGNGYEDKPWAQYKDKVTKKPEAYVDTMLSRILEYGRDIKLAADDFWRLHDDSGTVEVLWDNSVFKMNIGILETGSLSAIHCSVGGLEHQWAGTTFEDFKQLLDQYNN